MSFSLRGIEVHATGLRLPTHLAIGPEGRLAVSEFGGDVVRDITEAGDYSDPTKGLVARGLDRPGGLLFEDDTLLVADTGADRVLSVGPNGEVDTVCRQIPRPYALFRWRDDLMSSTFSNGRLGITKIGDAPVYVPGGELVRDFPCKPSSDPTSDGNTAASGWWWPGEPCHVGDDDYRFEEARGDAPLLLCHQAMGTVYDVTGGGDFESLRDSWFAWNLDNPAGSTLVIMTLFGIKLVLVMAFKGDGTIRIIFERGDGRFSVPLAAGFKEPVCIRITRDGQTAYVSDRSLGAVFRMDLEPTP